MTPGPACRRLTRPAAGAAVALALAACGGTSNPDAGLHPAAEPAQAPPTAAPPVGTVTPVGGGPEGVVVGADGTVVVALRDPQGVAVVAPDGTIRTRTGLSGAPRHLALAAPTGPVLAPLEGSDTLVELSLAGESLVSVPGLPRQPHDAAETDVGVVVVTDELGGGVYYVRGGRRVGHSDGPVQPGGLAAVGPYAVVADVRGQGVWVYDSRTQQLADRQPIGDGLTHAVAVGGDRVAVADTDGGAVIIVAAAPALSTVATIATPGGRPYGLAYDPQRQRLYVTLTASNTLVSYDLRGSEPRRIAAVPTVRQPNSAAVDPRTGDVLVTGTAAGELQRVPLGALG